MRAPQLRVHSTWDKEVEGDEEDKMHKGTEQVVVEVGSNARNSPTTCAIKHKEEVDKEDVATMVVS